MRKTSKKQWGRAPKKCLEETGHLEGKHFCDCRTRGYYKWLSWKTFGYIKERETERYNTPR